MKLTVLITSLAAIGLVACGDKAAETATATDDASLESLDQRLSYMVGTNMAQQFERDGIEIDITALSLGIEDVMGDKDTRLSEEQVQQTIAAVQERAQKRQQELQSKQQEEQAQAAEKNKAEGEAYLAANKDKEGVVTTESGLQYKEITAGEGSSPKETDTVSVHYKGTLVDGTEFDSSYKRGEPATFPVNGVIPGWVEALQLMNVGDKWELAIPSDLAYGPGGTGSTIGPNSTLLFEVELLEIVKPAEQ
ncbi:MAG: FKBP-type peptidyl-prolyl cis-trans isomerase [Pseudomonadota bacterium]